MKRLVSNVGLVSVIHLCFSRTTSRATVWPSRPLLLERIYLDPSIIIEEERPLKRSLKRPSERPLGGPSGRLGLCRKA